MLSRDSHHQFLEEYLTGWWFEPLWKILASWDYCSQYMGKTCSKSQTSWDNKKMEIVKHHQRSTIGIYWLNDFILHIIHQPEMSGKFELVSCYSNHHLWQNFSQISHNHPMKRKTLHEIQLSQAIFTLFYNIPSGKRLHNYGKSPFWMGKATISMAIFNNYVTNYQRVYHISHDHPIIHHC